jgi:hypothetical protein
MQSETNAHRFRDPREAADADPRRRLVLTAGIAGAGILSSQKAGPAAAAEKSKKRGEENEVGAGGAEPLAGVFETFVPIYQNHAAREDTIVFPAWKEALSERQLREIGDKFEGVERQTFGKDGFEHAVQQIAQIEQTLGFADLAQFTAPPPPKA